MSAPRSTARHSLGRVWAALLVGVVAALVFAGLASAGQVNPGWTTTVIHKTANQPSFTAQMEGDYVVYLDGISTASGAEAKEVYLYRISTAVNTRIFAGEDIADLHTDGRFVVWVDRQKDVWLYDLAAGGSPKKIFSDTGGYGTSDASVSYGRVVWLGSSTHGVWSHDVFVYDIALQTATPLLLDGYNWPLVLDGDLLAWIAGVGADSDVMLRDLSTGFTKNLSAGRGPGLADSSAQVDDGRVVWVGDQGGETEVFLYDSRSGMVTKITDEILPGFSSDLRDCARPRIEGRWVTWIQGSDFLLADAQAADPAASSRVVSGGGGVGASDVGGGWLAFEFAGMVQRYVIATGATEPASDWTANGTAWNVQTDGAKILFSGWQGVFLLEPSTTTTTQPTTTTTQPSTTTTLPPTTTTTGPPGTSTFSDVPASHPYHDAIIGMADQGIINGYTDGTFGPDRRVWRQHFAKMIVGTLGFPCSEADHCAFSDVDVGGPTTLYPDNYIAVAAAFGITKGIGGGKFAPYNDITRAQVITMVVRAAQEYTNGLSAPDAAYYGGWGLFRTFRDPTHGYNAHLAEFNGLLTGIQGSGDVSWWAYQPATRGEVAQILWNLAQVPGLAG